MEYNEVREKERKMSIPETTRAELDQQEEGDENDRIYISLAVKRKTGRMMGIGILAENNNRQVVAQWALKEFSSGNKIVDQVMAV